MGNVVGFISTGVPSAVNINSDNLITTNFVRITTGGSGTGYMGFPLVQVLIQPQ